MKDKCSKSPPLVLSWTVTEPNQHFAQNRKERESVQRNEKKKKEIGTGIISLLEDALQLGKKKMIVAKGQTYKLALFYSYKSKAIPKKVQSFLRPCF